MRDRRAFTDTADYQFTIDTTQQIFQIFIPRRIFTDHCVLDSNTDSVIHQASDRVESGVLIQSEVVFIFRVQEQLSLRRVGNSPIAALESHSVSWIAARQGHHAGKAKLAQQLRLIDGASV